MTTFSTASRWEAQFPARRRGTVANIVLEPIRRRRDAGEPLDLEAVTAELCENLRQRIEREHFYSGGDSERSDWFRSVLEAIDIDDEAYRSYIRYRGAWDDHDEPTKEKLRRFSRDSGSLVPTTARPATQKQVDYLRALGYSGPPPSSLSEASQLIAARKGGR